MRFLKISTQHALNTEHIAELKVTGREDAARLIAVMKDSTLPVIISHHKNFRSAEIALADLIDSLEGR